MNKCGFTLVELSIVLVIIGLLIGGILVGQSLIESASNHKLVQKMQQFEIARLAYNVKYNGVAGDSTFFVPPGNGDGDLDFGSSGSGCIGSYSDKEYQQYWAHLSQANILSQKFRPYEPSSCPEGSDSTYTSLETEEISPIFAGKSLADSFFEVQESSGLFLYRYYSTISEGVVLDIKLDDGDNSTGNYKTYITNPFVGQGTCQERLAVDASDSSSCYNIWLPDK